MSDNLKLYEQLRAVPDTAKKEITGGRLNGMTDISPMWRIKMLTQIFGPCGFGWKYTVDRQWVENGNDGVMMAMCNITLYVKQDGSWSDGIPGTGGATLIAKEKNGLYSDDEAFKKALTDALSVACKALGMGADVYWEKDSKYGTPANIQVICPVCGKPVKGVKGKDGAVSTPEQVLEKLGMCAACYKEKKKSDAERTEVAVVEEETII